MTRKSENVDVAERRGEVQSINYFTWLVAYLPYTCQSAELAGFGITCGLRKQRGEGSHLSRAEWNSAYLWTSAPSEVSGGV